MTGRTLEEWLQWQEGLHPNNIALGLERSREVARRLSLGPVAPTIVTVAGTNGKGSSVALLESILLAAGYRVGSYTSPHLLHYNERVRVNGRAVADQSLCQAFAAVERVRDGVELTYFEFGTLAALHILEGMALDVVLLEVGLGGRLDAVNIVDPDVALVTSIGLDHMEWLGPDREAIGYEKAGVMRGARPVVCGDPQPPASIARHARGVGAPLVQFGQGFGFDAMACGQWTWWHGSENMRGLPAPALPGSVQLMNAASVLQVLALLRDRIPLSRHAIEEGLRRVRLPGRFQSLPGRVETILDLAHNPDAARWLAKTLDERRPKARVLAVFSALKDKDVEGMVEALSDRVTTWYTAPVTSSRGLALEALTAVLGRKASVGSVRGFGVLAEAYGQALEDARTGDLVLVFGSAYTVAEVLAEARRPRVAAGPYP